MIIFYIAIGIVACLIIGSHIYFWHRDTENFTRIINNINYQSQTYDETREATEKELVKK